MSRKRGGTRSTPPIPNAVPAHTGFVLKPWHCVVGLAAICLLFYCRVVTGSGHFWEDLVYQEFPHRLFARDSILGGSFPLWNPYTFGGMPFFAALHTGVLYPFNLLMSIIPAGVGTYWYLLQLMVISHVFLAGLCMFAYARHSRLSLTSSLFAGVGYMLCGFFVTQIIHSLMLYIVAWLPLVVLLLEKGFNRGRLSFFVGGGLILGFSVLAGHPQITFYEFLFLAAYSLWFWFHLPERKPKLLGYACVAFLIAVGISVVQILPAAELSRQSARMNWTFEQASEGSLSFRQLLTFAMPRLFGAWTGATSGAGSGTPSFWLRDSFNSGYYTYWETCFYPGIAVLVLAIARVLGFRKDRFVKFCLIWGVVAIGIALGNHFFLYRLLFRFVPGFDSFRIPARILFTLSFLLPMLAARGLDDLSSSRQDPARLGKLLFCAMSVLGMTGIAVALGFLAALWPIELEKPSVAAYAARQGWLLLLNVLIVAAPLALFLRQKLSAAATKAVFTAALLLDLTIFGINQHVVQNGGAPGYFAQNQHIADALSHESRSNLFRASMRQFHLGDQGALLGRKTGVMILKKNQGMISKIQLIEGYNPLNLYRRLPPARGRAQFGMLLDLLNVRFFINPQPRGQDDLILANPHPFPRARMFYTARVLENDSLVRAHMTGGTFDYHNELVLSGEPSVQLPMLPADSVQNEVTVVRYSPNRIALDVRTSRPGILWLSEIWYPAWRCFVDGRESEVLCADYSFRAVAIPAGQHNVEFMYRSSGLFRAAIISVAFLIGSVLWLILDWRSHQQQTA